MIGVHNHIVLPQSFHIVDSGINIERSSDYGYGYVYSFDYGNGYTATATKSLTSNYWLETTCSDNRFSLSVNNRRNYWMDLAERILGRNICLLV